MNPQGPMVLIPQLQSQPSEWREDNQPPARVMVGLRFLEMHNRKIDTKIAVNDISIQEVMGLVPTEDEVMARDACLVMLTKYFKGELKPDEQENYRRKANKNVGGGTVVACPVCLRNGQASMACTLCLGVGRVTTFPMTGD